MNYEDMDDGQYSDPAGMLSILILLVSIAGGGALLGYLLHDPDNASKIPHKVTYKTVCINNVTYLKPSKSGQLPELMLGTDSKVVKCEVVK